LDSSHEHPFPALHDLVHHLLLEIGTETQIHTGLRHGTGIGRDERLDGHDLICPNRK
jgi:hypothetical protein